MRLRRIVPTVLSALAICASACGISSIGGIEPAEVPPERDATPDRKKPAMTDGNTGEEPDVEEPPVDPPPKDAGVDVRDSSTVADADSSTPVSCTEPTGEVFNGHCYFLVSPAAERADQAQACTAAGAHLATATSSAERDVINGVGSGSRWIGLTRQAGTLLDKASFTWVTGETVPDFWENGEPNGTESLCGIINSSGAWEDRLCTGNFYDAVCERE